MKIAIVSVTSRGAQLGQTVRNKLVQKGTEDTIECYEKESKISGKEAIVFTTLSAIMGDLFDRYDKILCIMATGIVVRLLAPYIKHKSEDPAIVVMDEQGTFAISLLSGHLGGANEWTAELADLTKAIPVITTATDVNHLPAPDVLARKLNLTITDFEALRQINSAIVAGESVEYYLDSELVTGEEMRQIAKAYGITLQPLVLAQSDFEWKVVSVTADRLTKAVVITDKIIRTEGLVLYMYPKTITIGVGCRRDTEEAVLQTAVEESLKNLGRSEASVLCVTSVDVKADEVGLLRLAEKKKWPIHFYTAHEIQTFIDQKDTSLTNIDQSNFVRETIGVGNVCETTSLLMAQSQQLLQKKTIYPRTTVAIAQVHLKLSALDQVMQNL